MYAAGRVIDYVLTFKSFITLDFTELELQVRLYHLIYELIFKISISYP